MSEPTSAAPAQPDNASVAEDFVDIFVSPSKVFARRAKASPMLPFLVVCIVMTAIFFSSKNVLSPIFDAQFNKAMAQQMKTNPQLTPELVEKSRPISNIIVNVAGVVGLPILLLVLSLVLWVVGRFFMGGMLTYGTSLLILSFSMFPRILSGVLGIVQGLVMDVSKLTEPAQVSVSVARFLDPASMTTGLYQLLSQVDLFTVWSTVLVVIGLMHAAKLDKSKATVAGVIMFAVGCVPSLFAVLTGK